MQIDHLVWYSRDLSEARRSFAAQLGTEPLYGGEHPGEGTANAVLSLGPSTYLEILGRDVKQRADVLDPEVASLPGHGLYHWAVSGVDLEGLQRRASAAGLQSGGLVPGGRVKPDGKRLDWLCWGLHGPRLRFAHSVLHRLARERASCSLSAARRADRAFRTPHPGPRRTPNRPRFPRSRSCGRRGPNAARGGGTGKRHRAHDAHILRAAAARLCDLRRRRCGSQESA